MKRSLKNLLTYTIEGKDGSGGKVEDFLFDEDSWVVRYIESYFDRTDPRKRVLLPQSAMKQPNWQEKSFHLKISHSDIEKAPVTQEHLPVSREYEKKLLEHYQIDPYWPPAYAPPSSGGIPFPPRPLHLPHKEVREEDMESNLRSFSEIRSYRIKGTDGTMGQVEDIVVDDQDWQIVYLIADTNRWLPWSKTVVLSVEWLEKISYLEREVQIHMETSRMKEAPPYDPSHPIDMDYEKALEAFYKEHQQANV